MCLCTKRRDYVNILSKRVVVASKVCNSDSALGHLGLVQQTLMLGSLSMPVSSVLMVPLRMSWSKGRQGRSSLESGLKGIWE